jgi:repressor LexA
MGEPLFEKQKRVFEFIKKYIKERGYPPTIEEIKKSLGLSSTATVHKHLLALERKGYIRRERRWRGLEIVEEPVLKETLEIPLYGPVAAGTPLEVFGEVEETVEIPTWIVGRRKGEVFALRVQGKSMIDAYVDDGDIIVLERTDVADSGEMVVALLSDGSVTLKRLKIEKDRILLLPENPAFDPIEVEELRIVGKVIGVIRKYR